MDDELNQILEDLHATIEKLLGYDDPYPTYKNAQEKLKNFNPADVAFLRLPGRIQIFLEALGLLIKSLRFLKKINNPEDFFQDNLQKNILKNITNKLSEFISILGDFFKFFDNPSDLLELENSLNKVMIKINPLRTEISQLESMIKVVSVNKAAQEVKKVAEDAQVSFENILKIEKHAKQAAGKIADAEMAIHYENISNTKIKIWKFEFSEYNFWIMSIFVSLFSLILVSFYFDKIYFQIHSSIQNNLIISSIDCFDPSNVKIICMQKLIKNETFDYINIYSYIAGRLTTIIALFILLFFCIKNFNVNKHNYIIYQNKATIFRVSQAARAQYSGENEKLFLEKFAEFLFKLHESGMEKNTKDVMPYEKALDLLSKAIAKGKD
jgi:hypothetical protein